MQTDNDIDPAAPPTEGNLRSEIQSALNRESAENGSNTPDFVLAQFLVMSLNAFDAAVAERERWYGRMIEGRAPPHDPTETVMSVSGEPKPETTTALVGLVQEAYKKVKDDDHR